MLNYDFEIDRFEGMKILRDDKIAGGTKSRFINSLLNPDALGFVYASPVEGGFQIALSAAAKRIGKPAFIFSALRARPHQNSIRAKEEGGRIMQIKFGRMSNVAAKARKYAEANNLQLIKFGGNESGMIDGIAELMRRIIARIGEPEEIFCAVGSGTLIKGIIKGSSRAKIIGIQVGKLFRDPIPARASIVVYPKPFDQPSGFRAPFASCANYDLKALEFAVKLKQSKEVLFWNVL